MKKDKHIVYSETLTKHALDGLRVYFANNKQAVNSFGKIFQLKEIEKMGRRDGGGYLVKL